VQRWRTTVGAAAMAADMAGVMAQAGDVVMAGVAHPDGAVDSIALPVGEVDTEEVDVVVIHIGDIIGITITADGGRLERMVWYGRNLS